jgi:MFS family permease
MAKIACAALRAKPARTKGEVPPTGVRDFQYNSLPEVSLDAESIPAVRPTRRVLGLPWPAHVTEAERRSLIGGGLGWLLDAMDVSLYSLVLAHLILALGMSKGTAGALNSLTLVASALGGLLFGVLADRTGRKRALMASILVFSIASGASGLSQTIFQLGLFRLLLGLGMGGEWATGAALIAETWPAEHRGKALGLMQSAWAIGEICAVFLTALVLPRYGWRAVFFAGVLPALFVFWIRRRVPESPIWKNAQTKTSGSVRLLWRKDIRRNGAIATLMNAGAMFGYWGFFTWIPAYLSLPVAQGGRGLGLSQTTWWLVLMGVGKWLGYTLFGFMADWAGRRRAYASFLVAAAVLVPLYGVTKNPLGLLLLGPLVAFFGTGYFSGYSAIASELFPTEIRATAMGISYNAGRGLSALAPLVVGVLAERLGLGSAFIFLSAAFSLAAALAFALPETKGKVLV